MDEELTLDLLIAKIQDPDDKIRAAAWDAAGPVGAAAVAPLAKVMAEGELEISRAAKRALWAIVRYVGRPGADEEKKPVIGELLKLLGDDRPVAVRREVVWMLSEIGCGSCSGEVLAKLLRNEKLREDARCALERIPDEETTKLLVDALESIPGDFRLALAHSLRVRGVEVDEKRYPCQKLAPTRQTQVKPAGA